MNNLLKYIIIGFYIAIAAGCRKMDIRLAESNENLRSAAEFLHNNFAFSLFYAAVQRAGMENELNGAGPFTILAPTDAAFNQRGIYTKNDIDLLSPDSLRRIVSLHVLKGKHPIDEIPAGTFNYQFVCFDGHKLVFSRSARYTYICFVNGVGINIIGGKTDVVLRNGLLHEVNGLLNNYDGTVGAWLEQQGQYKILVAGLKRFGYWPLLTDSSRSWTVLPPSDSVFLSRGITMDIVSGLDTTVYAKRLFGAYLFPAGFFTTDLFYFGSGRILNTADVFGRYMGTFSSSVCLNVVGDENWSNAYSIYSTDYLFLAKSAATGSPRVTNFAAVRVRYGYPGMNRDIVTSNGIVDKIDKLLLLPGDAVK